MSSERHLREARELLARLGRWDSALHLDPVTVAMVAAELQTRELRGVRAGLAAATAEVEDAIATALGHATAGDPHGWLHDARETSRPSTPPASRWGRSVTVHAKSTRPS